MTIMWGGGDTCGPCNAGTPEEGDVTTYQKEGGAVIEPTEATIPTEPTTPTAPRPPEKDGVTPIATKEPSPSLTRYPRGELDVLEQALKDWPYRTISPFAIPSAPTPTGEETPVSPIATKVTGWTGRYGIRPLHLLPREGGAVPTVPTTTMGRAALAPSERGIQKLPRLVGVTPEISSLRTVPTTVRTTPTMGRPSALAPSARPIQKLPRLVGVTPEISSLRTVPDEKAVTKALAQNRIERSTGIASLGGQASRRWIR